MAIPQLTTGPSPSSQWTPTAHVGLVLSGPQSTNGGATGGSGDIASLLPVTPESIETDSPARTTVTQTLGGAWIDFFGEGLQTVTITGHTGWRSLDGSMSGADHARDLYALYKTYIDRMSGASDPSQISLYFVNGVDGYASRCTLTDFKSIRSKEHPLLFHYQVTLITLGDSVGTNSQLAPSATQTVTQSALFANSLSTLSPRKGGYYQTQYPHGLNYDPRVSSESAFRNLVLNYYPSVSSLDTKTIEKIVRITKDINNIGVALSPTNPLPVNHYLIFPTLPQ